MDWHKIISFTTGFTSGELVAFLVFYFIRSKYEKNSNKAGVSIAKGMLERFAILLGLVASIPTIIVFFGALKLGTRLKEQQESKVSNDYFLIGNVVSIIIAIAQFLFYQYLNASCWRS
jgi:hypothetical protein